MNMPAILRSALYLPASNARAIEKSRTIDADAIVFDLEDSVAPDAKETAREQLINAFAGEGFGNSYTVIRSNTIDTTDYLRDLDMISHCAVDAVLLPKVASVKDIETFERDAINNGLAETLDCWYMIETVSGVVNLESIIAAGLETRYQPSCLVVGHNDLAKETGVALVAERLFLLPWLMQIVLQAKHHKLGVLDSVCNQFSDLQAFEAEALQGKQMGFSGKTLIHPAQVEPANRVFAPSEAEIAEAKAIVAAFERPQNLEAGVINLDGQMVERLHLQQARALLAKVATT